MKVYNGTPTFSIIVLIGVVIFVVCYIIKWYKQTKLVPHSVDKYVAPKTKDTYENEFEKNFCEVLIQFVTIDNEVRKISSLLSNFYLVREAYQKLFFFKKKVEKLTNEIKTLESRKTELISSLKYINLDIDQVAKMVDKDAAHFLLDAVNIIFDPMNEEERNYSKIFKKCTIYVHKSTYNFIFLLLPFYIEYSYKSGLVIINTYKNSANETITTEYSSYASYDDEISSQHWRYQRADGGPDRRYNNNYATYYLYRGKIDGTIGPHHYIKNYSNKSKTMNAIEILNICNKFLNSLATVTKSFFADPAGFFSAGGKGKAKASEVKDKFNSENFLIVKNGVIKGIKANYGSITNLYLSANVESIDSYALRDTKITNVFFDGKCRVIGYGAFQNSKIKSFNKTNNIKKIDMNAFEGCENLAEIHLPNVEEICYSAFRGCKSLKVAYFGKNLKKLSYNCFEETSLKEIIFAGFPYELDFYSTEMWGYKFNIKEEVSLANCNIIKSKFKLYKEILSFEIKTSKIPPCFAFNNTKIYSLVLNNTIDIGEDAFNNVNLKNVRINNPTNNRLTVLAKAFSSNKSLSIVEINSNKCVFHSGAFANCPKLEQLGPNKKGEIVINEQYQYAPNALTKCLITKIIVENSECEFAELALNMKIEELEVPKNIDFNKCVKILESDHIKKFSLTESSDKKRKINSSKVLNEIAFGSSLEHLELPKVIITITNNTFSKCRNLNTLILPEDVLLIPIDSFQNLQNLRKVVLNENVENLEKLIEKYPEVNFETFKSDKKLLSVSLNDGLALEDKIYVTKITIPKTCKSLTKEMLDGYLNLTKIDIEEGLEEIGENAFSSCGNVSTLTIPKTVNKISEYAFSGCKSLKKINFKNSINKLSNYLFYECELLEEIKFPDNLTEIGQGAFSRCTSLKSISIPDSVFKIGKECFRECHSLLSVILSDNIEEIGAGAFLNCVSLKSFIIPSKITNLADGIFEACINLKDIKLKTPLKSIGKRALKRTSLSDISFIESVDEINDEAFMSCHMIKEVSIPYSIKEIKNGVFADCKKINKVSIPSSVKIINCNAFKQCVSLKTIIGMDKIEKINPNSFKGCISLERLVFPRSLKVFDNPVEDCNKLNTIIFTNDLLVFNTNTVCIGLTKLYLPANIESFHFMDYDYYKFELANKLTIYSIRGTSWRQSITSKKINFEYYKKEEYSLFINNVLLENGYTVGYSSGKIKFKSDGMDNFNFGDEAFNHNSNVDEMYYEQTKPVEKKRASWDTTLVSEGETKKVENTTEKLSYQVNENIFISLPLDININENLINLKNKSVNSITSNIFVLEYDLIDVTNNKTYWCFVDDYDEVISTIDQLIISKKDIQNLKMQFELLPNAENGACYLKVYDLEMNLLYKEKYFIDRAFTFDDDFGIF